MMFRDPNKMMDRAAYALTNLQFAASVLENANHTIFNI